MIEQFNLKQIIGRVQQRGQRIRDSYRVLNRLTHHVAGALLKLVIVVYFLFCTAFLVLRYAVLPHIDEYKGRIERLATEAVGNKVSIARVYASWHGLRPYLFLSDVVIRDASGQPALTLPAIEATVSWWSAALAEVRLDSLVISRPDVAIRRDAGGALYVAGIRIDDQNKNRGQGADWVLSQHEIVIRDGTVHWNDQMQGTPELTIHSIDFVLKNRWRRHRLALKATPPESMASPMDVRADFVHPRFAQFISDAAHWRGEVFVHLSRADLSAWKKYIPFPIEVQQGAGSIQAWLNFNQAHITDVVADVNLSEVSTRLKEDLPWLNVIQMSGRVFAHKIMATQRYGDQSASIVTGHKIGAVDFSLKTKEGLVLPATTFTETFEAPDKGHQGTTYIEAKALDLETMVHFAEYLPLPEAYRDQLKQHVPRGQLQNFSVQWSGEHPDTSSYRIKGQFSGLSLKSFFEHLTGSIDADNRSGTLILDSKQAKFFVPNYFPDPVMPFDQLTTKINWSWPEKESLKVQIDQLDFAQEGVRASISGSYQAPPVSSKNRLGVVDINGTIHEFNVKQIGRYLPVRTDKDLRTWLTGALVSGTLRDASVRVKGDLADMPFRPQSLGLGDELKKAMSQKGEFKIFGMIDNGVLNYAPTERANNGTLPLWPLLEHINGTILFDHARMEIKADSAQTVGASLTKIKAVIPDIMTQNVGLDIEGSASGELSQFLRYVIASPVTDWIGHATEEMRGTGPAILALKLQLPLSHLQDTKVQGSLRVMNDQLILQEGAPPMTSVQGTLEFNEKGFSMSGMNAYFLGGQLVASGGVQRDGSTLIKAEGLMVPELLRKSYTVAAFQPLLSHVRGSARYTATVSVKKQVPEMVVESSLKGLILDFPVPLRKAANDAFPFKWERKIFTSADARVARDEVKWSLGSAIAARYQRQKTNNSGVDWELVRGGIGVNTPVPEADSGLLANLNLKALDLDEWRNFSNEITPHVPRQSKMKYEADLSGIAQYMVPDVMSVRASEMILSGKKFEHVVLGASRQKDMWQANIDADQVSGYVTWRDAASGQGLSKVTARLASLQIPQESESEVVEWMEGKNVGTQIPNVDVTVQNFELFGKKLGHLELVADNALSGSGREWQIKKLLLSNPDAEFNATGQWISKARRSMVSTTNLTYSLVVYDAGQLLGRFGTPGVLRGGKGKMQGDLNWKGLPFSLDIPSLSGKIQLEMGKGQFLKVDPGAAKLLGVLSLQSLPRRLTLDFRDVFSEGFSFDEIFANAVITNGIAKTDNFKMRGVSATVLMDGTADIAQESQNLHVVVIPEINAGTASLYAFTINPVLGVGSFLAQLFLRNPLIKAFTYEYQITGPWQDPVVVKLNTHVETTVPASSSKNRL